MMRVFIPEPIANLRRLPFLAPEQGPGSLLFQNIPANAYAGLFERVGTAEEAELVIAPHEYASLKRHPEYLASCVALARHARKPLLISAYQDAPKKIAIEGAFVLRPSTYKSELTARDIIMPAYVEDMGSVYGMLPLPKDERPTVGFMGKSDFAGMRNRLGYMVKNYALRHGAHREGLYFRRRALETLKNDPRIELHAVMRKHYSANRKSIELPPEEARGAYVASIQDSQFTLAPRGDGNYSLRFYETLSLGRIPILIDTDMPLPLEDRITYDDFVVRVPWQDMDRIGDYVLRFWEHAGEGLEKKSQQARQAFEQYLYMPAFLRTVLTKEYLQSRLTL